MGLLDTSVNSSSVPPQASTCLGRAVSAGSSAWQRSGIEPELAAAASSRLLSSTTRHEPRTRDREREREVLHLKMEIERVREISGGD